MKTHCMITLACSHTDIFLVKGIRIFQTLHDKGVVKSYVTQHQ